MKSFLLSISLLWVVMQSTEAFMTLVGSKAFFSASSRTTGIATSTTSASSTTTTTTTPSSSSQLYLFGGKKTESSVKREEEQAKMQQQMELLQKAQQISAKKKAIDEELKQQPFLGTAASGAVHAHVYYIPSINPMDPTPGYDVQEFKFNTTWYDQVTAQELSMAVQEAIQKGIELAHDTVTERFSVLEKEIAEVMGAAAPR
eukprot:Nitzschia sp. Nitz4//scaffold254_size28068//14539//15144//NITZ4_008152-RA/size28068-processed-gene-0.7-mRNA-1//-1//CDS//3329544334//4644//frame0